MTMQTTTPKIDPTYGSDEHGLVWGYEFTRDQPARRITSDEIVGLSAALDRSPSDQFVWLHFSLSNLACEPWLRQNLTLPEAFYESLHGDVGVTRLEQDGNALVAVFHDVLFDFKFDASEVSTTNLCVDQRLLVSARVRPLRSLDRLRAAVRSGQPFRSTAELIAHLLRDQSDVLMEILREPLGRADEIEDSLLTGLPAYRRATSRSELGSLRRVLVRLQRLLAPEPAALFRLLNRPADWITKEDLRELQGAAEQLSAAVGSAAALVERIKLLQEELAALVAEQTSRTIFVLTVFTVLALPVNVVAGLFGMNVGGIPLQQNGSGFFLIVGALTALTAVLAYLGLLRNRD